MSSEAGSADAVVALYESQFLSNCCAVAAMAIIAYSWLTSLAREVKLFWKGPSTGARVLYFSSRHMMLFSAVFSFLLVFDLSDETCTTMNRVNTVIGALPSLVWATFSGLRVYALTKNYPLSILVFLLAAVPFATNIAQLAWDMVGVDIAPMGCTELMSTSEALYNTLLITTRTCVIAADLLVILSTWWAIPGRLRSLSRRNTFRSSSTGLFGVMFRDGMVYFLILSILNSLDMGLSLSDASGFAGSIMPVLIDPITSVLVSTFLLNLQEVYQRTCRVDSDDPLYSERNNSLVFTRVVGSLGASIEHGIIGGLDDEDIDTVSDQQDYLAADEQDLVATDGQGRAQISGVILTTSHSIVQTPDVLSRGWGPEATDAALGISLVVVGSP